MAHTTQLRATSFVRAVVAAGVVYAAATFGVEAPVCGPEVDECGGRKFWEILLAATGGSMTIFAIASMAHALTLEKSWSKLAVGIGNFAMPLVVGSLFALGVLVAVGQGL